MVRERELDLDARISREKLRNCCYKLVLTKGQSAIHTKQTMRRVTMARQLSFGPFHFTENAPAMREVSFALRCQDQASCCSMQEADAKPTFHARHCLGHS